MNHRPTIQSPLLPQFAGYLDGKWVRADAGRTLTVRNPATGERIADVPDMGETETRAAVAAADRAWRGAAPVAERRRWLLDVQAALLAHRDELARIITLEQGKPFKESLGEVDYAAGFFRVFASHLDRLAVQNIAGVIKGARWAVQFRPAGVAGLITPWNFPLATLAKKLPAALGAGCSVVIKPAELTPLSAIALVHLCEQAGVPAGRVNLVTGQPAPIGKVLCEHPAVRVISFTGSTRTGQLLAQQSAPHMKRLALELGGNAPFIVFDDADLEAAANGCMVSKFRCAGQTCVCANRVYVHESVAEKFTTLVAERVRKLCVGDGMKPDTDIGPLINRATFEKVARHVQDALAQGAERIVGSDPEWPKSDWGCYFPPTVVTGVKPTMLVFREETFGPLVAISHFRSEAEVIGSANDTPYGLAAYVFTRDPARAQRCAEQLSFGYIGTNTGTGPTPEACFGGWKMSGYGREGGAEGLLEFCETQCIATA
jgi:succinate-semialdehyde dehydrogenase/glutarate-semialdehyde dehydrogenase